MIDNPTMMLSSKLPALDALANVRKEVKRRIGKEGGNLNDKMLAWLQTIEATLQQLEPLGNMLKVVNNQTELAVRMHREMSRLGPAKGNDDDNGANGDDGSSETKGA
jgi:hypothetical protein